MVLKASVIEPTVTIMG